MRLPRSFLLVMAFLLALPARAAEGPDAYTVTKLAEGVYGLVWSEQPVHPEPNVLIVVNDEDVLVVDSSLFPSTSRTIISEIRKLTPKPVRFVVNTHWHDDHVFGNGVYRETYPGVQFIAHPNTRKDAAARAFGAIEEDRKNNLEQMEHYRNILRTGKKDDGSTLSEESRKRVELLIGTFERYEKEIPQVRTQLPDVTFEDQLTLHRGSRTIDVRFLGRGNTRGDVVVWLPAEKILATGDLVVAPSPFGIQSYYSAWSSTLEKLMKFDAKTIFLSHGAIQHDFSYVATLRNLLSDLVSRVGAEVARGATLEEVQQNVTMADWKTKLSGGDVMIGRVFDAYFVAPAVPRAYHQAKGEVDPDVGPDD